jgi:hypothetical protein
MAKINIIKHQYKEILYLIVIVLIYSLLISPYTGEFVEFGEILAGNIKYSNLNYPGINKLDEVSGLIYLSSLYVKYFNIFENHESINKSIVIGILINALSIASVYKFCKIIKFSNEKSFFVTISLLSFYFGNIAAYPLYYPTHFFTFGQIGFYAFFLWTAQWFNSKNFLIPFWGSAILMFLHPIYGLISCLILIFNLFFNKNYYKLLIPILILLFGRYCYSDDADKRSTVISEIDWINNTHHLFNVSVLNLCILSIIIIIVVYELNKINKQKSMIILFISIFLFVLILLGSKFSHIIPNELVRVIYRANFGRFYDFYILASAIFLFKYLIKKESEHSYQSKAAMLFMCFPLPVFWGMPHIYIYQFIFTTTFKLCIVSLISHGKFDKLILNKYIYGFLNFRMEIIIIGFIGFYLLGININHKYDANNEIYSGEIIRNLRANQITSIITPGRVHGIEGLNVQIATNLPVWVPFNDAIDIYCGLNNLGDYKKYVSEIRSCFSSRTVMQWQNICEKIGNFAILDFTANNISVKGSVIFNGNGITVYKVCNSQDFNHIN